MYWLAKLTKIVPNMPWHAMRAGKRRIEVIDLVEKDLKLVKQ